VEFARHRRSFHAIQHAWSIPRRPSGWRRWRSPSPLQLRRKCTTRTNTTRHARYHHYSHYGEGRQIIVHSQAPVVVAPDLRLWARGGGGQRRGMEPARRWEPVFYGAAAGIVDGVVGGGSLAAVSALFGGPGYAYTSGLTDTAARSRRRSMRTGGVAGAPFQVVGGAFAGTPAGRLLARPQYLDWGGSTASAGSQLRISAPTQQQRLFAVTVSPMTDPIAHSVS